MKPETKYRLFWWLRTYWHLPNAIHIASKPQYELILYLLAWSQFLNALRGRTRLAASGPKWKAPRILVKRCHSITVRALGTFWRRAWWRFWWVQPFRCGGNCGGWRTGLCEWLEDRARDWESVVYKEEEG